MRVKSVVSALALSAAMMVSGAVVAQDAATSSSMMIGEQSYTEADAAAIQERCLQLTNADNTESLGETDQDDDDSTSNSDTSGDDAGDASATLENAPEVNEAEAVTSPVDFDAITLEQCQAAGIGSSM